MKGDASVWIDDPLGIRQKFIADYTERFRSVYQNPKILPALGLPAIITQQDNEILNQLPTNVEIKKAVFDINLNKNRDLMILMWVVSNTTGTWLEGSSLNALKISLGMVNF